MGKDGKYWELYGEERSDQRHNTTKVLVKRYFFKYMNTMSPTAYDETCKIEPTD